jgi:hypothetical protein
MKFLEMSGVNFLTMVKIKVHLLINLIEHECNQ